VAQSLDLPQYPFPQRIPRDIERHRSLGADRDVLVEHLAVLGQSENGIADRNLVIPAHQERIGGQLPQKYEIKVNPSAKRAPQTDEP